jgi:signal peptidase I
MSSDTSQSVPGSGSSGGDGDVAPAGPDEGADAGRSRAKGSSFFRELPFLVLVAFGLALLIKAFLVQAFYIPSGSMQQTLELRDRVLVNKLVYDFRDIHRGEIVVFDGLDSFTPEVEIAPPSSGLERVLRFAARAVGVGAPGEKDFIKRVIGLPGDRVACCTNGHVTVQPDGASAPVTLTEPYVYQDDQMPFCAAGTGEAACPEGAEGVLVPEGRLWVMGDHRGSSADSRFHIDDANSGTVPQDEVIGRAFVIVWPLDRAGLLGVPEIFDGALGALPSFGLSAAPYALGLAGALPLVALRRTAVARLRRKGTGALRQRG